MSPVAATSKKKLTKPEVDSLINELLRESNLDYQSLYVFAERINGAAFKELPKAKAQAMTMLAAKTAVLEKFNCKTVPELRRNKTFTMSMTGEEINLKTKDDWMRLYRRWVAVPESEREKTGAECINGINVLENFRPWHVFGLDPKKATADDIKASFRELVKTHHPDMGGDTQVFQRLQKMRDSLLALMS
jgi:hypothetical protein